MIQGLRNLHGQLEFARHVPWDKVAARAWLTIKRRVLPRFRSKAAAPTLATHALDISATAPRPIFAPRELASMLDDGAFELNFLNEPRRFSLPFDWHPPELSHGNWHLWRMNLHYHEFVETLSDDDFCLILEDWINRNGRDDTGYWVDSWSAYSLSIRVVVWMQQIVVRGLETHPMVRSLIVPSLVAQMRFLEANLEKDLGGNHLIKNIKALFWAGAFFTGDEAQRFSAKGRRLLSAEQHQILADGMHYERSPSYHAQVFADLLEIRHAHGSDPLAGRLDPALAKMAEALGHLTHPDGGPALFNDAGLTMAYSAAACTAAYAHIFGHPPPVPSDGGFELPEAGYFGFRSAGPYVVVDCGRIAPDDLPAHGHGDVLSLELSWGGHRFIVDQGVYEYNAGPKRQASRSAASHNTLCVEGADQADFFGSFRVGRRPKPMAIEYSADHSHFRFSGSHDGFEHLPGSPRHFRRIEATTEMVRILDRLEGAPEKPAAIGFLLHPEVALERRGDSLALRRGDVRIDLTSGRGLTIEDAIWWSDMGWEHPTVRLKAVIPAGGGEAAFEFRAQAA